jgi:predicted RNase H-like HicB family nuclease
MQNLCYIFWQDGDAWLRYLEEFSEYITQGKSLADLEEHLRDIYKEVCNR